MLALVSGDDIWLAKNRDYDERYLPFQTVLWVEPTAGYRYLTVSTHTFPGVNSSGLNERGLAVVDAHVRSSDAGPGLPKNVLMGEILNQCTTVGEAVQLASAVRVMGRGVLLLADMDGDLAAVELGYQQIAAQSGGRFLVRTNHFVMEAMRGSFVPVEPEYSQSETVDRYKKVQHFASTPSGITSLSIKELLASHDPPALCRHPTATNPVSTISSALYSLRSRTLELTIGPPCVGAVRTYSVKNILH